MIKGQSFTLNHGWRRHSLVSGLLKMKSQCWFINTLHPTHVPFTPYSHPTAIAPRKKNHGGFYKASISNAQSQVWHSHFISHQQFYNKSLGLRAEVSKHALFKSHVIVPDVEDRAPIILSSKGRHPSEAEEEKESIVSPRAHRELMI